jgi:hypothetical protein
MRRSMTTAYHYPLRPGQGLKIFPKIFPGEHPRPESHQGKGRGCFPGTGTDPIEPKTAKGARSGASTASAIRGRVFFGTTPIGSEE